MFACMHAKSLQLCLTVYDPMDYSLPSSSVHGILQARILEWVTFPFSRGSSWPRDRTHISYVSCVGRQGLFTTSAPVTLVKSLHFLGVQFLYLWSEEFLTVKWFGTKNVQQSHLKIFKSYSYWDPLPNQLNHIWVEALKRGIKKLSLRQLEFKPVF